MKQVEFVQLPEVDKMYEGTLLPILPDYGIGGRKLGHAVIFEGGKVLLMSGYPALSENGVVGKGDMGIQVTRALELVKLTVERAGGTWNDIVHVIFYFTDRKQFHQRGLPARIEFFKMHSKPDHTPCITSIGVSGLMHPDMMIEIEGRRGARLRRENVEGVENGLW